LGLQTFGTVFKAPVAAGADLVGYTFPTASDYFQQPYNSSIGGIGTGDFCVMGWFKNAQQSTGQQIDELIKIWLDWMLKLKALSKKRLKVNPSKRKLLCLMRHF
jgi:hypothetical protein